MVRDLSGNPTLELISGEKQIYYMLNNFIAPSPTNQTTTSALCTPPLPGLVAHMNL